METATPKPKPAPPKASVQQLRTDIQELTKSIADTHAPSPLVKKPRFVPPEHLTTKPLANHEALLGLKKELMPTRQSTNKSKEKKR